MKTLRILSVAYLTFSILLGLCADGAGIFGKLLIMANAIAATFLYFLTKKS